jgi:arylsulfatase A-like enzyme
MSEEAPGGSRLNRRNILLGSAAAAQHPGDLRRRHRLWNISFNNRGLMGYRTPNIDRIHNEGATFTDYYAEQSCTAGRAAFITGQSPVRTGLTKVGLPGAAAGMQKEDPTIAEC